MQNSFITICNNFLKTEVIKDNKILDIHFQRFECLRIYIILQIPFLSVGYFSSNKPKTGFLLWKYTCNLLFPFLPKIKLVEYQSLYGNTKYFIIIIIQRGKEDKGYTVNIQKTGTMITLWFQMKAKLLICETKRECLENYYYCYYLGWNEETEASGTLNFQAFRCILTPNLLESLSK